MSEQDAAGLEARYEVRKINDTTGKHADCRYFVLDPQHDPIARTAIGHYATSARLDGHEALYRDLMDWIAALDANKADR